MRNKVKIAKLSVLLVLLSMVSWGVFNRILAQKIIKASDAVVQQDFRLKVSNKWHAEKENSFIDLVWEDVARTANSGYQLHRSEDGINWSKISLAANKTNELPDVSDSNRFKQEPILVDNKARDNTVKDDVPPEVPKIKLEQKENHQFNVELSAKDRGKEHQWYVTANTKNSEIQKSDIIKVEATSDLKGYIYVLDNEPTTVPTVDRGSFEEVTNSDIRVGLAEDTTTISGIDGENNSWIHVVAVDRANNVGDVKHVELKTDGKSAELRDVNRFVTFNIERTADTAKLVDVTLGHSMEKKMKSFEIKIPKNIEIKNYDKLDLPTSWYKFQNSDDGNYRSFTLAMADKNDLKTIKTFLEALQFIIKNPTNQKGDIQVIFHELVYTSWESPDGKTHYYTFVPTQKTWLEAYNLAKKMKYKGLTGYLATLASAEEHNFVYTNIAKQSGWLGGGRLVKSNGQKINDEAVISEKITDFRFTGNLSQQWYWVNGPEKGVVFFDKPTHKDGGKAPVGVYQGFNNPANGGNGAEPNNSGVEYILEFAQASAGVTTKLWNDLSYNRTSYNTGYYIEFSEYGSQKETREETDVLGSSKIPQKVSVKAFNEKNNQMASGDFLFDQRLRIGKKEVINPKKYDMFDFIKLTNAVGTQLSQLEYTITDTFQEGKLIYSPRKLTVHSRQVTVNKDNQLVLPKSGFGVLESKTKVGVKKDEFSLTMNSTEDNAAPFDTFILRYQSSEPLYTFRSKIPMNYGLMGYVLTTNKQQHWPATSSKTPVQVDVSANSEFWLTTYITPVKSQRWFYHWEYKANRLGEIKLK